MAFMKQLHHQMAQEKQTTENGAVGYIIPPENICWMLTLR